MIIVTYDFTDDKIRTKFSKFLEKYGRRLQYSVFILKNSKRILENVKAEIEKKYQPKFENTDSILLFQMCKRCEDNIIKYGCAGHEDEDVVYFG